VIAIILIILLTIVGAVVYAFVKSFFKYGGEFRKTKSGFVVVMFPWFLYSVFSLVAGVVNILLNDILPGRAKVQPTQWSDAPHSPQAIKSLGEKRLAEIKKEILENHGQAYEEVELVQLWDTLEPATSEDLIRKTFKNKIIDVSELYSDNFYEKIAKTLSKFGMHVHRRFVNKFQGDSLLLNILDLVVFPLPIFGNVGIKELNFRGKVGIAMCYDHQPWIDYFRILDEDKETGKKIILAFSTCRDQGAGFYTLTYRPEIETL
jgi:hypothetical protein